MCKCFFSQIFSYESHRVVLVDPDAETSHLLKLALRREVYQNEGERIVIFSDQTQVCLSFDEKLG